MRVVRHWKVWKVSLPMSGGLELDDLLSPFQTELFCDSVKQKSKLNYTETKVSEQKF